jgi:glucokinase
LSASKSSSREAIGIDLGGTKMLTGVVDEQQRIHYEHRERSTGRSEDQLVEELGQEIEEARAARPGVVAAGLGIPSTIDQRRGLAISSVNLPIADVPIREVVSERVGLPVFIDNDANCAALAEHLFGAGRGSRDLVLLTIGTGIGGGLIVDGEVYRGSIGAAAELGHMVIDEDGPPCQGNCPNHGCVEALASGTALGRAGREAAEREPDSVLGKAMAAGEAIDGKLVTTAAREGDRIATGVVAEIGRHLGVALASYANIFNPNVIVIGGGAAAGAGELLLEPARAELRSRALRPMNETPVKPAELGEDAGMIGAAAMALRELSASG